jgi:hypothetical protein
MNDVFQYGILPGECVEGSEILVGPEAVRYYRTELGSLALREFLLLRVDVDAEARPVDGPQRDDLEPDRSSLKADRAPQDLVFVDLLWSEELPSRGLSYRELETEGRDGFDVKLCRASELHAATSASPTMINNTPAKKGVNTLKLVSTYDTIP